MIYPSNFEKISLVGQNIATRREKNKTKGSAKKKGCPHAIVLKLLYIALVFTMYILHQVWIISLRVSYKLS